MKCFSRPALSNPSTVFKMTRQPMLRNFLILVCLASGYLATRSRGGHPAKIAHSIKHTKGCRACGIYRCPADAAECLLGLMPDVCGCCPMGICARLGGESCWNASIPELPKVRKNEGLCSKNYICKLRDDLQPQDLREATCVCKETNMACGSNNRTYETTCALHEEAVRLKESVLQLQHLGPCPSRPSIYSTPKDVEARDGQIVSLNCEAKGFPLPDIYWEFHSADGRRILRLPSDELEGSDVNTGADPEISMQGSWVQLEHFKMHHVGTYYCIANNSYGEATAASRVSIA